MRKAVLSAILLFSSILVSFAETPKLIQPIAPDIIIRRAPNSIEIKAAEAPEELSLTSADAQQIVRSFLLSLDNKDLPTRLASQETRMVALDSYFSKIKEDGEEDPLLYFYNEDTTEKGNDIFRILGFKYAEQDSVLFITEISEETVNSTKTELRNFFVFDIDSAFVSELPTLPGVALVSKDLIDFKEVNKYPKLVNEIKNDKEIDKKICIDYYEGLPDHIKVSVDYNSFIETSVPINNPVAKAKLGHSFNNVYAWDGATFRQQTFLKEKYGIFEFLTERQQINFKLACKATEGVGSYGLLSLSFFDIDMDGTPEIFVRDEDESKSICFKKGTSYEFSNLGSYTTQISIMPNVVSVRENIGRGVVQQKYILIENSKMSRTFTIQKEYNKETGAINETYLDCTKEEVEELLQKLDKYNVIPYQSLYWTTI